MTWKELKDKISLMTEEEQQKEVAVWGENMNLMKDCSLEKTDEDLYYNTEWDYTCEESELEPEDKNDPDVHKVYEVRKIEDATEVVNLLVRSRAFKVGSKYLNRSYERLNVINEGVVPAVEGCVGYTNEEFERVNKENNDPESAKIGSFNKTVEEANNIRSRVLKYVDKIKQERAYNIDLCMTFERYIEIADKDAERLMKKQKSLSGKDTICLSMLTQKKINLY